MAFSALGYESASCGQGQWNGVAILSRVGIDDVVAGFSDQPEGEVEEARLLWATCGGVRVGTVYVPNGRQVGSEHYAAKLEWLARLRKHVELSYDPSQPLVLCGDFNVALEDRDVWDATKLHGGTHISPPEREAVAAMIEWGLVDVLRRHYDDDRLYSWWDYRAGDFHQHRGLRIDLDARDRRARRAAPPSRSSIASHARARARPTTPRCSPTSTSEVRDGQTTPRFADA